MTTIKCVKCSENANCQRFLNWRVSNLTLFKTTIRPQKAYCNEKLTPRIYQNIKSMLGVRYNIDLLLNNWWSIKHFKRYMYIEYAVKRFNILTSVAWGISVENGVKPAKHTHVRYISSQQTNVEDDYFPFTIVLILDIDSDGAGFTKQILHSKRSNFTFHWNGVVRGLGFIEVNKLCK